MGQELAAQRPLSTGVGWLSQARRRARRYVNEQSLMFIAEPRLATARADAVFGYAQDASIGMCEVIDLAHSLTKNDPSKAIAVAAIMENTVLQVQRIGNDLARTITEPQL